MKKKFHIVNIVVFVLTCILTIWYDREGGLWRKAVTGSGFLALGIVNLVYAFVTKTADKRFSIWMTVGLAVCLAGDIVLNITFLPGVAVFALGHIFYIVAFGTMMKWEKKDLIPVAILFAAGVAVIKLVPILDFGDAMVEWLCVAYALVLSTMVGKTIANFLRRKEKANLLMMIGGCLFYFSDLMLVLHHFGSAPGIVDSLCLFSYFPAQCLLAYSMYHKINQVSK